MWSQILLMSACILDSRKRQLEVDSHDNTAFTTRTKISTCWCDRFEQNVRTEEKQLKLRPTNNGAQIPPKKTPPKKKKNMKSAVKDFLGRPLYTAFYFLA